MKVTSISKLATKYANAKKIYFFCIGVGVMIFTIIAVAAMKLKRYLVLIVPLYK